MRPNMCVPHSLQAWRWMVAPSSTIASLSPFSSTSTLSRPTTAIWANTAPAGFQHLEQPQTWLWATCAPTRTLTGLVLQRQVSVPPAKPGVAAGKPLSTAGWIFTPGNVGFGGALSPPPNRLDSSPMISSSAVVIVRTVRPIRREGNRQLVHEASAGSGAGTPRAGAVRRGAAAGAADRIVLDYRDRLLRRRRLTTAGGLAVLVDLPETVSLEDGDALVLDDGRLVAVEAAAEPLVEVTAPYGVLARLAWHIGNRHAPAQIDGQRILVQRDHVIEDMLARLGAATRHVAAPFHPEGGAYGHGRTHGHHHGGVADDPDGGDDR